MSWAPPGKNSDLLKAILSYATRGVSRRGRGFPLGAVYWAVLYQCTEELGRKGHFKKEVWSCWVCKLILRSIQHPGECGIVSTFLQITVLQNYCIQSLLRLDFAPLQFQEGFTRGICYTVLLHWKDFLVMCQNLTVLILSGCETGKFSSCIYYFEELICPYMCKSSLFLLMQKCSSYCCVLALCSCLLSSVFLWRREGGCGFSFIFL